MSWTAAHPADEITHVDTVRHGPRRHLFAINRVGQVTLGVVGHLRPSCLAQHVNYVLPGELHRDHRTLAAVRNRRPHTIQRPVRAAWAGPAVTLNGDPLTEAAWAGAACLAAIEMGTMVW